MKLLSIAIPCYNSQEYMEKAIKSLLVGGEEVEIIVVNDGSSDKTEEIGRRYAEKYPTIVKLVNKVNGGHGSAVNAGIANATGTYFKVVDSDDWVSKSAYMKVLETLRKFADGSLDVLISNYVYEKVGEKRKRVMHYHGLFPKDQLFTWSEAHHSKLGHYILMHSVIYRTQVLRDCGLKLPEHTFYVDNLFVFQPFPYVKTLYYLDVNFYRYFIGREDQSVHENVMMGRIDQQLRVNKLMVDYLRDKGLDKIDKHAGQYMMYYLEIITTISSVLLIKIGTKEAQEMKKELWDYIRVQDERVYKWLKHRFLGFFMTIPGKGLVARVGYDTCQKIFQFN